MPSSIRSLPLLAALLLACPPPKESETSATTGSEDDTIGHSSAPQTGTATAGNPTTSNTSNATATNTTTPPDETTGSGPTGDPTAPSSGTSSTTTPPDETTSTSGEGCVPDPPEPKMCNKVKGADDPGIIGASTGDRAFIMPVDAGSPPECDIFEQNCPEGQKCNAWSSDGDNSWDSTKCVPIDPNPDPVGAPCTVEGSGVSGVDSCVKGAMCWGVDDATGEGTCIEQCTCSIDNPICAVTPNSSCIISNEGVLVLCLPSCDPLDAAACNAGEVCISNPADPNLFICVVDSSGAGGKLGDPCAFANACDPGLLCANPELLPACDNTEPGCCVPFCDLSAADCPPDASCLPWYEEGQAPKCFEDIGVCGLQL